MEKEYIHNLQEIVMKVNSKAVSSMEMVRTTMQVEQSRLVSSKKVTWLRKLVLNVLERNSG